MNRRELLVLVTAGIATAPLRASAAPREYGLVHPAVCLAGDWGEPRLEWRVQLGVFGDDAAADRYVAKLAKASIESERYIALWLQRGDAEPPVVVSEAVLPSLETARRLAEHVRGRGFPAFARRYTHYLR